MAELSELSEKLSSIKSQIESDLTGITSSKGVFEYKKSVMDSKEGKIGSLMREMGKIPKEQKAEYLALEAANGNTHWQNYVLFGNNPATASKLIPQIVKAAEGSSVVTIKATDEFVLSKPVRSGVNVSFQLLKREGTTGNFAAYGAPSATPEFTVDVSATEKEKKIGSKTFWKIQTIFSCEEER